MKPSEALRSHRDEIKQIIEKNGLSNVRIFGSVIRGEDTDKSDLDILVDALPYKKRLRENRDPVDDASEELERLLGVNVSIIPACEIKKTIQSDIMREATFIDRALPGLLPKRGGIVLMLKDIDRVRHILEAIAGIREDLSDIDRERFLDDGKTQRAVIQGIVTVGEAASHLSQKMDEKLQNIPLKSAIRTRNRLVHGYHDIDLDLVYDIATKDMPTVENHCKKALVELERELGPSEEIKVDHPLADSHEKRIGKKRGR